MRQRWTENGLCEGVVFTKEATALRDGELQQAAFCRLLPGNTTQLYPDVGYDTVNMAYSRNATLHDMSRLSFEGGQEYLMVIRSQGGSDPLVRLDLFDLNNPVTNDDGWMPSLQINCNFGTFVGANVVPTGAEYIVGVAVTGNTGRKVGSQFVIGYDDDADEIVWREVGLDPADDFVVSALRGMPLPGNTLFDPDPGVSGAQVGDASYLVRNQLYGTNDDFLEEWPTQQDRADAGITAALDLLSQWVVVADEDDNVNEPFHPNARDRMQVIAKYVPVSKVELRLAGTGYVFGYWVTEYEETYGVESAPSELVTAASGNPNTATWEVTVDWEEFFRRTFRYYINDAADDGERNARVVRVNILRDRLATGRLTEKMTATFPLSDAQKEDFVTTIELSGSFANSNADTARLYRQNLGRFDEYLVEYVPATGASPQLGEAQGEGLQNASDINAGKINRQGGLLTEFARDELPTSYEDRIRESGIADPGLAYPTIPYVRQGTLGVYEYLRKPDNFGVGANMSEVFLRVAHAEGVSKNLLFASPVGVPEQSPLIYAIPVVTERQDEVTAMKAIQDVVVVFTTTSAFRLNYIPFESSSQQDKVLTQITGNHGCATNRLVTAVESGRGQVVVWLSKTGLMATNGSGWFDICPDFSVEAAARKGYNIDLATAILVNNAAQYRLELWFGGYRLDFVYHPSHLKDIRGDGVGLVFKMLGPTQWYAPLSGAGVRAACSGAQGTTFKTWHIYQSPDGGYSLSTSNTSDAEFRYPAVQMRRIVGSDPTSTLITKAFGVQHGGDLSYLYLSAGNISPTGQGAELDQHQTPINTTSLFSWRALEDGAASATSYVVIWKNAPVGPLWAQLEEAPGGFGR